MVFLLVGRDQGPPSEPPWYTRLLTWPKASQVRAEGSGEESARVTSNLGAQPGGSRVFHLDIQCRAWSRWSGCRTLRTRGSWQVAQGPSCQGVGVGHLATVPELGACGIFTHWSTSRSTATASPELVFTSALGGRGIHPILPMRKLRFQEGKRFAQVPSVDRGRARTRVQLSWPRPALGLPLEGRTVPWDL